MIKQWIVKMIIEFLDRRFGSFTGFDVVNMRQQIERTNEDITAIYEFLGVRPTYANTIMLVKKEKPKVKR